LIDETHDAARASWVASANGHRDFPIQNLPFGVFAPAVGEPRGGVAIGDQIFDLAGAVAAGLFAGEALTAARAASGATLNAFLALGVAQRTALRRRLSAILAVGSADEAAARPLLYAASGCTLRLPTAIGDYTDFYAGIHHATAAGRIMRPTGDPLLPNYKHLPVGYHGRASSVRPSGTPVVRPRGQTLPAEATAPTFGPSAALDYELEVAVWIGPGNALGQPIPIGDAGAHIAGLGLLNDWSARDVQRWEGQPLGPFLAKSFMTSVSPWIVTAEALAPFRAAQAARPAGDPAPLPHLSDDADQSAGAFDIALEALLLTPAMRARGEAPASLSRANMLDLYWTPAQMVAHHASGGCNLAPGDLFGTGTISAAAPGGGGCLLELTQGGRNPVTLPDGETRAYLQDGDEVIFRAQASRAGFVSIGFGETRGVVQAAA